MHSNKQRLDSKTGNLGSPWVCSKDISGLVEMGKAGHFPLFLKEWLNDYLFFKADRKTGANKKEGRKINKIILALRKAQDLEEKQELLTQLPVEDRNLFIMAFLTIIEGQILDAGPDLH